jgi:alpha-tubulin suppressor-like RCC1 family protein
MVQIGLALGLALGLGTGCYNPRRPSCVVSCDADGGCPRGMSCSAGLCTAGPTCTGSISAGETHSCAVRGGGVLCWGGDRDQQLGGAEAATNGAARPTSSPTPVQAAISSSLSPIVAVAAGGRHTCAVGRAGQVACWGDNGSGQLGYGDRQARSAGDGAVPLPAGASAVAAGLYHTCALLEDAGVRCWGDNRFGQLGAGRAGNIGDETSERPVPADVGGPVQRIAAGAYHTCALLVNGTVKCWGWNDYGQLGVGDERSRGLVTEDMGVGLPSVPLGFGLRAIAVAAGGFHSCAIVVATSGDPAGAATGSIKCWGANGGGRLGIGRTVPSAGGRANDLGDALPAVDVGTGRTTRQVVAGGVHTCALLDDFSIRCWGYAGDGELGIGTTTNRGASMEDMGTNLPAVPLGAGLAATLAAGANHACAVHGPDVTCWGQNNFGQLGIGDSSNRGADRTPLVPVMFDPAR